MNHVGTRTLRTERLVLRRFTLDDARAMYENWASDSEVTRYLSWSSHPDVEASVEILKDWIASYETPSFYNWAVVPAYGDMPIGSLGLHNHNETDLRIEAGYCIGRPWWGKGYVPEALRVVIRLAFEEIGVNRLQAVHFVGNAASGRVMVKAGMSYEGRLRGYARRSDGILADCDLYAIIRDDFL